MFNGLSPLAPATLVDGAYFIDEDPDVFNAVLTWLRHGVVDRKFIFSDHLATAASYLGLEELQEYLATLVKEEKLETENRWRDFYEKKYETLKWSLDAIANGVKDLPNFMSDDMLEFHVAMAISALRGGTLTQICSHICLQQLSENSHTAPQDICSLVMFTLKRMRDKFGPLKVFEDGRGVWQFAS